MTIISPSILTCDFLNLSKSLDILSEEKIEFLHLDVMDGNYVPNISFGPKVISDLRKNYNFKFDTHLMIQNPENLIEEFAKAGSDYITIHPDSTIHLNRQINLIKSFGKKAGIALNPAESPEKLKYILDDIDLILVMSVNPGFGGQKLIESSYEKISEIKKLIEGRNIILEVDGGIKPENLKKVIDSGADAVVMGSAIFNGEDVKKNLNQIKEIITK